MSPAAGLSPLRVGPEDIDGSEAGELVKDLGIAGQAKGLINAVAKQMPAELRTAISGYEHVQRSRFLNEDEVLAQCKAIVGDSLAEILSARVKGRRHDPLSSNVVILYSTTNDRTGRCAVNYQLFPKSIEAFDKALKDGTALIAPTEDPEKLKKHNEALEAELRRVTAEGRASEDGAVTEDDGQGDGETKLSAVPEDWNAKQIVAGVAQLDDAVLADLAKDDRKTVAKAAKAEAESRKG